MTTQFGTQPRLQGSRFFPPPAVPVCAFTRADIERRYEEAKESRRKRKRGENLRQRPSSSDLKGAALIQWMDRFIERIPEPVVLDIPPQDKQAVAFAATLFGLSVAELVGAQKTSLLLTARRYVAKRMDAQGRSTRRIALALRKDQTTIQAYLGRRRMGY